MDVSVIIASAGRPDSLIRTLQSLGRMDNSDIRWEIVLALNGVRTSGCSALLQAIPESISHRIRVMRLPDPGKCAALNAALAESSGELLLFTDDDVIVDPQWMGNMVSAARAWPVNSIFGGKVEPMYPENCPSWLNAAESLNRTLLFSEYPPDNTAIEGQIAAPPVGPNMAVSAALVGDHKFDTNLGPGGKNGIPLYDETDFVCRLAELRAAKFIYVPASRVRHVIRTEQVSLDWLASRARQQGRVMELLDEPQGQDMHRRVKKLKLGRLAAKLKCRYYRHRDEHRHLRYLLKASEKNGRLSMLADISSGKEPEGAAALRQIRDFFRANPTD